MMGEIAVKKKKGGQTEGRRSRERRKDANKTSITVKLISHY